MARSTHVCTRARAGAKAMAMTAVASTGVPATWRWMAAPSRATMPMYAPTTGCQDAVDQ